ncbi:hypothetical protein [Pseudorhodoferax sp. Leaf267]|uniref:hypothetical protein n=1 Tax=Pseudorhodoferax sp. Leaf267 TaxID=1736316 RepID=UPI00138F7878|nr:hypothetical protein [Pseudorhodoferax sp. Leaf267]
MRQPLTSAGYEFLIEPSLDSLVFEISCNSKSVACQLNHRGSEVNRHTHALVVNRLSPYQNASLSLFRQSEIAACLWAVLSSLSVPVLNRPSNIGLFPGTDLSYLAKKFYNLGWRFSRLFGASIGDLGSKGYSLNQGYQALETCFAFLLVADSILPILGGNENSEIRNRLPALLKNLADEGIVFAFVAVVVEDNHPSVLEINPWPAADFIQAYATPVAKAISKHYR